MSFKNNKIYYKLVGNVILNHLVFVDLSVFVEEQSVSGESRVAYIYLSRPMGCLCNVALITSINISTKIDSVIKNALDDYFSVSA
jgi:hypothetical protein